MTDQVSTANLFQMQEPALISFPNLLVPARVSKSPKEEPKYSISIEFEPDHADLAKLKAEIGRVAAAKWPGKDIGEAIRTGALMVPITAGDKLAAKAKEKGKAREWSVGKQVLTARSQHEPALAAIENGAARNFTGYTRPLFKTYDKVTGNFGLVEVNLQAYDGVGDDGKPGVTAYLNAVIITSVGPKLAGGGRVASEVFKSYVGANSDEDPTGGEAKPSTAW